MGNSEWKCKYISFSKSFQELPHPLSLSPSPIPFPESNSMHFPWPSGPQPTHDPILPPTSLHDMSSTRNFLAAACIRKYLESILTEPSASLIPFLGELIQIGRIDIPPPPSSYPATTIAPFRRSTKTDATTRRSSYRSFQPKAKSSIRSFMTRPFEMG